MLDKYYYIFLYKYKSKNMLDKYYYTYSYLK